MTKCITALAVCVALLSGCAQPAPTVVSVKCTDKGPGGGLKIGPHNGFGEQYWRYYETYYWSDGTKTYKGVFSC